ncbi:Zinc finger, C2H2-type [Penicillium camemberti]|uniref:Zinc finger, C2H2-type n=1 Tax=Penicillium camemberti (strain FM 013) TaxID=1429867 RepID=A0A0G4PWV0_PENC3|nr:Zinc finger, C2H2-type [Penicillium camemberti]
MLPTAPLPKRQKPIPLDESGDTFSEAIASVCVKFLGERPTICFMCLSNTRLPERERLKMYKNPGSLSRHFVNKHIKPFPNDMHCECNICGEKLMSKPGLLNHAQRMHGTVSCLPLPALGLPLP